MRKTIEVSKVRDMSNRYALSQGTTPGERLAIFHMASQVLSETGNYKGFKYAEQVWDDAAGEMFIGDESRRLLY